MATQRYDLKQLNMFRCRQALLADKGKRHYWGDERGDYGFYSSEDKKNAHRNVNLMKNPRNQGYNNGRDSRAQHRRLQSVMNNYEDNYDRIRERTRTLPTKQQPYGRNNQYGGLYEERRAQSNIKNSACEKYEEGYKNLDTLDSIDQINLKNDHNSNPQYLKSNEKRNKRFIVCKNIDISLPAIKKSTSNIDHYANNQPKQYNSAINKNDQLFLMKQKSLNYRFKTDITTQDQELRRNNSVRYSPTYVCSDRNPMPTRKLYSNQDKSKIVYDMIID